MGGDCVRRAGVRRRHREVAACEGHGGDNREDRVASGAAGDTAARVKMGVGPQDPLEGLRPVCGAAVEEVTGGAPLSPRYSRLSSL